MINFTREGMKFKLKINSRCFQTNSDIPLTFSNCSGNVRMSYFFIVVSLDVICGYPTLFQCQINPDASSRIRAGD